MKLHSVWSSLSKLGRTRSCVGAFTLPEVLIAVFVLGILTTALYGAFSFGFTVVKLNQENVRADQILVEQLENLRYYDWAKVTNGFVPATFQTAFSTLGTNQGVLYFGSVSITNAPVTESYGNTLRQVTVAVSWVSCGQTRNRSMATLVSQNGIANFKP